MHQTKMISKNRDWQLVTQHNPLDLYQMYDLKTLRILLDNIRQNNLKQSYLDWCKNEFRRQILLDVMSKFWKDFDDYNLKRDDIKGLGSKDYKSISSKVFAKINTLYTKVSAWIFSPVIELLLQSDQQVLDKFRNQLKLYIRAAFQLEIHLSFDHCLLLAYSYGFKLSMKLKNRTNASNTILNIDTENATGIGDIDKTIVCDLCQCAENSTEDHGETSSIKEIRSKNKCSCQKTMDCFIQMNAQLREINLLEIIANDAILSIIHSHIEGYILENCKNNFEVSWLSKLESWVQEIVIEWLKVIYGDAEQTVATNSRERLIHFIYETYGQIRIEQMFDIIVEYPESEAALRDLKYCIEKCTGYRKKVIDSLKESFNVRLLHPGVATNDILTAYIQAIKALRVLDNSGVILELVCDPVKKYLINRDDTVRCIITALTDDGSELIPDLSKNAQINDEGNQSDDEYICSHWQEWSPDPLDAGKLVNSSKSLRTSDIVSILVNVYESKDLFVEEYQRLLAQKFLSAYDCNEENERRNLELLTLRFGESDLDACEVMLKDMSMSKKIDIRINVGEIKNYHFTMFPIRCLVISAEFWPENLGMLSPEEMNKYKHSCGDEDDNSKKMKLPEIVQNAIFSYTKCFELINVNRTMYWIYSLGQVELDLEFTEDKKLSFTVSPIHASIIWNFQEKTIWTINELSQKISVPSTILRRKIAYWQNKGILKEIKNDVFILVEDLNSPNDSIKQEQDLKCSNEDEMMDSDDENSFMKERNEMSF